jgi:hypothetical protein
MPKWVKRIFLKVLPKFLFMRQPSEQIKIGNYSFTYANIMEARVPKFDEHHDYFKMYNHNDMGYMRNRKSPAVSNYSSTDYLSSKAATKPARSPEVMKAIDGINYVCEHLRREDEEKMV